MGIIHDLIAVAHARLTQLAFIEGLSALHALLDKPACWCVQYFTNLRADTLHAVLDKLVCWQCFGTCSCRQH